MGYGRYVGRVGALAVALGVGAAVVCGQNVGLARADDSPSADAASDSAPPASSTENTDDDLHSVTPSDTPASRPADSPPASTPTQRVPEMVVGSSGGALTSHRAGAQNTSRGSKKQSEPSDADTVPTATEHRNDKTAPSGKTEAAPTVTEPSALTIPEGTPPSSRHSNKKTKSAPVVPQAAVAKKAEPSEPPKRASEATTTLVSLRSEPTETAVDTPWSDRGQVARNTSPLSSSSEPEVSFASAPRPVIVDSTFVAVGSLLATALAPFALPGAPGVPTDSPALLAALAWARRQTQHGLSEETAEVKLLETTLPTQTVSEPLASLTAAKGSAAAATKVKPPKNIKPVAGADSYTTAGKALTVAGPGVLANDSDADLDPLTAALAGKVKNGTVTLNPDGSFTYTPKASFIGTDTFRYVVSDGTATARGKVTVTVTPNHPPVANSDAYSIEEDNTPLTVDAGGVLANDTDADDDTKKAVLVSGPANAASFHLNDNGTFTYTPNADFNGPDSFTYKVNDGAVDSNTATVMITVTPEAPLVSTVSVGDQPFFVAVSPDGKRAYVTNAGDSTGNGTVSVIDTSTNTELTTIGVGGIPYGVAVSPDGTRAYVTNLGDGTSAGKVSVIDTSTNTELTTIDVGVAPGAVAFTPDGTRAYVTNAGSGTVSVINTADNTVLTTIPDLGAAPGSVVVHPDGTRAYVTLDNNTVAVIDTSTNSVVTSIPGVGDGPVGLAISPGGDRVYTVNTTSNSVSVIDTATNTVLTTITDGIAVPVGVAVSDDGTRLYVTNGIGAVSAFDTATNARITTLRVGSVTPSGGFGLALSPNDKRLYVANANADTITVVNTTRIPAESPTPVGDYPESVTISPDGSRAYVANEGSDSVSVIDTTTRAVVATIPVGEGPRSVAVTPDGSRAYVTNFFDHTVTVIDTTDNSVVTTIPLTGEFPIGVAVSPDGSYAYVGVASSGPSVKSAVEVIDTGSNTSTGVIPFTVDSTSGHSIAFSPDGTRAYVTTDVGGFIGPPGPRQLAIIDTTTETAIASIPNGGDEGVAVTPDGTRVYAVSSQVGLVKVFDTTTNELLTQISVDSAHDVAISSDGTRAYVTSGNTGTVAVIDTATNTVLTTIAVGNSPDGVAVSPDGTRIYVTNTLDDTVLVVAV